MISRAGHIRVVVGLVTAAALAACSTSAGLVGSSERATGGTIFGSTVARADGENRVDALARIDASYGPLQLLRVYAAGLPPSWATLQQGLDERQLLVSFKANPAIVLSGAVNDELRQWFADAPKDRDTHWTYFHEPENNVESGQFTAEEYGAAWLQIAALAEEQDNARLHATVVLMCFTVDPESGRDWHDYVPNTDLLEVLAWDCYNHGSDIGRYTPPDELLDRAVSTAAHRGVDWAVAELGSRLANGDDGSGRAQWLRSVGEYAIRHQARFVTYFDSTVGGDYRLQDEPSIEAWHDLVTR